MRRFDRARCASCGAFIFWARTKAGKQTPVNYDPTPEGDLEVSVAGVPTVTRAGLFTTDKYLSHFATCPNASAHRRAKQ